MSRPSNFTEEADEIIVALTGRTAAEVNEALAAAGLATHSPAAISQRRWRLAAKAKGGEAQAQGEGHNTDIVYLARRLDFVRRKQEALDVQRAALADEEASLSRLLALAAEGRGD